MNAMLQRLWQLLQNWQLITMLLDNALKSFVLLALAGGCCLLCRRASAATRHLLWCAAVLGCLCFPLVSFVLPAWQKPLWAIGTQVESGNQLAVVVAIAPKEAAPGALPKLKDPGRPHASIGLNMPATRFIRTRLALPWVGGVLIIWSAGFLLVSALVLRDSWRLRALQQRAREPRGENWLPLLYDLCKNLSTRRTVTLLQSQDGVMPLTWGSLRPIILLPAEAEKWPAERRRIVLVHELAHVKRWDCLSQFLSQAACALYWFNPLVWIAARQMCVERERACDDLVLAGGFKPSDYAAHLVEIANCFRRTSQLAGIGMARSSQLSERISSIVGLRSRRLHPLAAVLLLVSMTVAVLAIGANRPSLPVDRPDDSKALLEQQLARLRAFAAAKLSQSQSLAANAGQPITPQYQRFYDAATTGDWQTVTNMYEDFKRRHPQYSRDKGEADISLIAPYWSPVLEICLAYDHVVRCEPKYTAIAVEGIINSIPPGSIYFGGTDPGRGLPTAFSRSQIDADPFFILTQNALADGGYLEYLRDTYASRIYTPSSEDSQRAFNEYTVAARRRLEHDQQFPTEPKQVRPGENIRIEGEQVRVSGQVAVMSINALLARMIFDQNPGRESYIEESFPLDWMYPHLAPHGLIMKIERETMTELPAEVVAQNRNYWQSLVAGMLGDWLKPETPVSTVADFVEKVVGESDLTGFTGDVSFIRNDYAKRLFSKLRSSISGVYAWRVAHSTSSAERQRLAGEADFAFRQAFALCPYSPEAVFRYVDFLTQQSRKDDALRIATVSLELQPGNKDLQNLVEYLRKSR